MKKKKFFITLIAIIATIALALSFSACETENPVYNIFVDGSKSVVIEVGDTVDFKQYFTVKDNNGNQIVVTDEMIDTSNADTSKEGQFTVTLNIGSVSKALTFTVMPKEDDNGDNNEEKDTYTVSVDTSKSVVIEVGDTVDFKQYFTVTDKDGKQIVVTDEMIDASNADTSKEGQFTVTLNIGSVSKDLTFTVMPKEDDNGDNNEEKDTYTVSVDTSKSVVIEVGDTVDFKQYFTVTDKNGNQIVVTDEMIDASSADTSKEGQFTVTLNIGSASKDLTFTVMPKEDDNGDNNEEKDTYTVSVDTSKSVVIEVGDTVDFKQYFTVTDKNGNQIVVTDKMIDTSNVDTSKEGQFTVTLNIGSVSKDLTFTVMPKEDDNANAELSAVFAKYSDSSKWNFAVTYLETGGDYEGYEEYYEYNGDNVLNRYTSYYGDTYTEYLSYDASSDTYYYYCDNGDGTYTKYDENTDEFDEFYSYSYTIDVSGLGNFEFSKSGDGYAAINPDAAGNEVVGDYGLTWTQFTVYIENGNIAKIATAMSDGSTQEYTFSKHGQINFTLPNAGSSGGTTTPVTPTGTMDKQTYDAATFDNERLQDKLTTVGDEPDRAIGLPSTGTYSALVVPIKFNDTTISQTELSNLNIAFNGTSEQTGWESVNTYYQKASYGKLNLSFDIAGYNIDNVSYYTSSRNYSYYETHTATENGQKYSDGDNVLLHEVLKYYESRLDLSKYDYNDDGTIDAVYLIYSAPVDYDKADFWWAYVTWNYDETKYDGKDSFYYMFTGLDFMKESVQGGFTDEYYPVISGLKVNAATYIHETGHLLGLDDYYDYEENKGCNEGLGGADMMDSTVGDQNVYSKIMLGWLTPEIVTSTATVTIHSSQAQGDAILIPLKFDNSYFCEYLLIDLYSAQGLNELHASLDGSYLYDGAAYGVRIYHISSWIKDPFNNDFGSFTDNNNSSSDTALIKLIEADGYTRFSDSDGYAAESDLWQTGDSLSKAFPTYTTNDGKSLIFDISIDSVSADEATITITYNS